MVAAVLAVTAASLKYLGRYQPFRDLIQQSEQLPDIALAVDDATVVGRTHGHRRWQLHARQITFSRDHRAILATAIDTGRLFGTSDRPLLSFAAGQASYLTPTGDLDETRYSTLALSGGIRLTVKGRLGLTMTAQSASWNASSDEASVPGAVSITFPNRAGHLICTDVELDTRTNDLAVAHLHGTISVPKLVK
jgi:hypothetical protein